MPFIIRHHTPCAINRKYSQISSYKPTGLHKFPNLHSSDSHSTQSSLYDPALFPILIHLFILPSSSLWLRNTDRLLYFNTAIQSDKVL